MSFMRSHRYTKHTDKYIDIEDTIGDDKTTQQFTVEEIIFPVDR